MLDVHFLPSTFLRSPFWNSEAEPKYSLKSLPSFQLFHQVILHDQQNNEPIMTIDAPKRIDFAISPCVLIPPSAIIGLLAAFAHQRSAANCQPPVPKPVFIFVIQTFLAQYLLLLRLHRHSLIHGQLQVYLHYQQ